LQESKIFDFVIWSAPHAISDGAIIARACNGM
jgi:hypothetical protein